MKLLKYSYLSLFILLIFGCNPSNQTKDIELIGHRGATGIMPENTIPAFKKALEYEVDSIEFDVVISGDNQVVVSHEPWFRHDICLTPEGDPIDEESQLDHLIYKMSYDEIAQYDCGSKQRPGYPDQETQPLSKPLMSDAINEVESYRKEKDYSAVIYNVEIKSKPAWDNELQPEPREVAQLVYDELQRLDMLDRIRIFAFDDRILNAFNEIDSEIEQVYLISKGKPDISKNLSKLTFLPEVYAPNFSLVDSSLIAKVHSEEMQIIPWTVNEFEDMVRLVSLGVDGIISDYPNLFPKLRDHKIKADKEN